MRQQLASRPLLVHHLDDAIPRLRRLSAVGSGRVGEEAVVSRAYGGTDVCRQRRQGFGGGNEISHSVIA